MNSREAIARWLCPELARRADDRDVCAARLEEYNEAFRAVANIDVSDARIFANEYRKLYGWSPKKWPSRPKDPSIEAMISASKELGIHAQGADDERS